MAIEKEVAAKESLSNVIDARVEARAPLEFTMREGLSETDKLLALVQYTFVGDPNTLNPDARAGCYVLMDLIRARVQEVGQVTTEFQ
ncbi:hypothetical protein ACL7TT_17110 [Microbulbifer sp. 2304DJ12-6]|uniref:hypothetical protein n=1 Tax=Microbulbifer sp. 2304DJ12-6 TaxID=3233340 RepID=UPI0039AF16D2